VRDEAHHGFTPAHFRIPLKREIVAALIKNERLMLSVVPSGILVDGMPTRPKANSVVHIASVSLFIGKETKERRK